MPHPKPTLKPRKTPVQARSASTVDAIYAASIQVLHEVGLERFTTTRAAERAGASVGTLYQYFPNKSALLAAVLERHLTTVVEAVEAALVGVRGQPVAVIANTFVNAYLDAKLRDVTASMALYAVAGEDGGAEIVGRLTQRGQLALCEVLATARDAQFDNLRMVSLVLVTALSGPLQALLASGSNLAMADSLRRHLVVMVDAYLLRFTLPAPAFKKPRKLSKP
ncbi:TetR/AcrR family transcriptional regulator [Rhodoferax sp.]|uniref:TetR/AcrR family transcriptional regulator n=1 Tax=Rhodoferax sp. TaxID=50421 RepID=UPI00374DC722